jgi:hypothetical protein
MAMAMSVPPRRAFALVTDRQFSLTGNDNLSLVKIFGIEYASTRFWF